MPSSVIQNQVPFSVLFSHPPLFSSTPCLWEHVFVHNLTLGKDKLVSRALKCVFLGYWRTQKRYQCYSPDLQWYHVTFFETQSYFTGPAPAPLTASCPSPSPVQPFTAPPLLTYYRHPRPASGPADSRPASDPAPIADLSPFS
uniref:Uncharacterized protein LOC104213725 n=1 Tax=Nicotiana sylvestris TaxID=4096 RepID=A0A1U7VGY3_NICSY|nr:PREDICTED: uncharacterized protein LOC104213725 [Nicotiana sylvestris]